MIPLNSIISSTMAIHLKVLLLLLISTYCESNIGLQLSFQRSLPLSTSEWAEYTGHVAAMTNFTTCLWMFVKYFSPSYNTVIQHCVVYTKEASLACTEIGFKPDVPSAGRDIQLYLKVDEKIVNLMVKEGIFIHRGWNHICWTYAGAVGTNQIFFNGHKLPPVSFPSGNNFTFPSVPSSKDVHNSALVLGQEQDEIRGVYDKKQLFQGNLSQFNIWDEILPDSAIQEMAQCNTFPTGNVVSWLRNNFKLHKIRFSSVDLDQLCNREVLFIFPQNVSPGEALHLCSIMGGSLVAPKSPEENKAVFDLVHDHKDTCFKEDGLATWIGIERKAMSTHWSYLETHEPVTYENLAPKERYEGTHKDDLCMFMMNTGEWSWQADCYSLTNTLTSCTVCNFSSVPTFTLKGACNSQRSPNWVYYLDKDGSGSFSYYFDGYKHDSVINEGGVWKLSYNDGQVFTSLMDDTPVGRRIWVAHPLLADECDMGNSSAVEMSLSPCSLLKEFTCDSGNCIDAFKRCDDTSDCEDKSDEQKCRVVDIPDTYQSVEPPKMPNNVTNPIFTRIYITSIDNIDTINGIMELTIEIELKWKDPRLTFLNIADKPLVDGIAEKEIATSTAANMWLPITKIIHTNAIIGRVKEGTDQYVRVKAETPHRNSEADASKEDMRYGGADNSLMMGRDYKIEYRCDFQVINFPFDEQLCSAILEIRWKNNYTIALEKSLPGPAVIYNGPFILTEFSIGEITSTTCITPLGSNFVFRISLNRIYSVHLTSTFIQTFLLWFLAYLTLFIDIDDFSNRFMGALTALLVLAALLSSMGSALPKSSYFKHIDFWFLFFIFNIFLIIAVHIVVDFVLKRNKNSRRPLSVRSISKVSIISQSQAATKQFSGVVTVSYAHRINTYAEIGGFTFTILFTIFYFIWTNSV